MNKTGIVVILVITSLVLLSGCTGDRDKQTTLTPTSTYQVIRDFPPYTPNDTPFKVSNINGSNLTVK